MLCCAVLCQKSSSHLPADKSRLFVARVPPNEWDAVILTPERSRRPRYGQKRRRHTSGPGRPVADDLHGCGRDSMTSRSKVGPGPAALVNSRTHIRLCRGSCLDVALLCSVRLDGWWQFTGSPLRRSHGPLQDGDVLFQPAVSLVPASRSAWLTHGPCVFTATGADAGDIGNVSNSPASNVANCSR